MPAALAARMARLAPRRPYLLWPGASTPLGTLGYVSAGLELAEAWTDGPPPDVVVIPLGSGGTAVGLAFDWRGRVGARPRWGVRAADAVGDQRRRAGRSSRRGPRRSSRLVAGARARRASDIARQWFGAGYGHRTRAGDEATRVASDMDMELEPTYTAKAFAAALDQLGQGKRVAFVQTFAGSAPS